MTVVVALVAIALCAALALQRMPADIFPQVGDPAIYVAQPYSGMDPAQMEGYLTYYYEYHFLYITGIDHVESKSIQGAALMKLVFHEGTNMSQAMSETVGYVNRARSFMPPGTVPPFITRFDAGSVAVGLLVFSSSTHTQGELQDYAINRVRPLFATLPGVSAPPPFGGNQRTIVITLDIGIARLMHDQRDLAEEIAAAQPDRRGGDLHLGGAGGDEIHGIAAGAAGDDALAWQRQARPQQACDRVQPLGVEGAEQRHAGDQLLAP